MSDIHAAQLIFFAKHAPFDRMERPHLLWMLERMQLAYYEKNEVLTSPQQGETTRFFVIKQGLVQGARLAKKSHGAVFELNEGECFPIGALLSHRGVTSEYRAKSDVFCFELSTQYFNELIEMSLVFKDFCTRRISALLEQSTQAMQAQLSQVTSDQQSFSSPLAAIIRGTPVVCNPDTSIRTALQMMSDARVGSIIVVDATQQPLGIFTLRDLLQRVALKDQSIDQGIEKVMSKQLVTLPPDALAYDAAMAMAGAGFRHVLVTESDGKLRGIISERDLFSLQRVGLHQLSMAIRKADTLKTLVSLSKDIRELTHNMMAQGVSAEQITQLISTLNDLLTKRIIELELTTSPDIDNEFCWIALGSEGRLEQTLNTDQDNGLIFMLKQGQNAKTVREKMLPFAKRINLALAACGFPLCNGEVMASNPKWCLTLEEWQATFANWIEHGDPKALLYSSIFFDFRPIYGVNQLAVELRKWLNNKARQNIRFLHQLAINALRNTPPLGLVRDFVTGDGHSLDLKLNGITPFVDAARILSLANGVDKTNTVARLRELGIKKVLQVKDTDALIEAFLFIQLLRLRLHNAQSTDNIQLTNKVDPDTLNNLDRRILKEAFRQARKLQIKLKLDYQV